MNGATAQRFTLDGSCVPGDVLVLYYRKDIFDERGLEAPTTWEEVAALGEEFTDEAVLTTGSGPA